MALFGKWASPYSHGHNYVLEAEISGPIDPDQRGPFDGSKVLSLWYNRISTLGISGGNGTDQVLVNACLIDQVFATLADGSDAVSISGAIVNNQAQFDGGAGFDLFRNTGSRLNGFALNNFEA